MSVRPIHHRVFDRLLMATACPVSRPHDKSPASEKQGFGKPQVNGQGLDQIADSSDVSARIGVLRGRFRGQYLPFGPDNRVLHQIGECRRRSRMGIVIPDNGDSSASLQVTIRYNYP